MKGLIFDTKKYSVNDGPGIRITFFMKGCPLSCPWCHNPEGISPLREQIILERRIGSHHFRDCEDNGRYITTEEILDILDRERIFFENSGGGVTFSGGEPMMQYEFLEEALTECRKGGYHTAIDTSGYASEAAFRRIVPFTDLFLYDLKHLDDARHIELTGVSNRKIKSNLAMLLDLGKEVIIRIPVIPGINDDQDHILRLRDFIGSLGGRPTGISLLPFHRTGASKYKRLNLPDRASDFIPPTEDQMNKLAGLFSATGLKVRIGG